MSAAAAVATAASGEILVGCCCCCCCCCCKGSISRTGCTSSQPLGQSDQRGISDGVPLSGFVAFQKDYEPRDLKNSSKIGRKLVCVYVCTGAWKPFANLIRKILVVL